jgi:hypothetical protein
LKAKGISGVCRAALRYSGCRRPPRRRRVAALTAQGGGVAPGRRSPLRFVVRSCESDDGKRDFPLTRDKHSPGITTRNRPELANRARPMLCRKRGIAHLSLSVHWACVIRAAQCGHPSCTAGAEIVERLALVPATTALTASVHKAPIAVRAAHIPVRCCCLRLLHVRAFWTLRTS